MVGVDSRMKKFECRARHKKVITRAGGPEGLQLVVNVYPIPNDKELDAMIELIEEVVRHYESA